MGGQGERKDSFDKKPLSWSSAFRGNGAWKPLGGQGPRRQQTASSNTRKPSAKRDGDGSEKRPNIADPVCDKLRGSMSQKRVRSE